MALSLPARSGYAKARRSVFPSPCLSPFTLNRSAGAGGFRPFGSVGGRPVVFFLFCAVSAPVPDNILVFLPASRLRREEIALSNIHKIFFLLDYILFYSYSFLYAYFNYSDCHHFNTIDVSGGLLCS